MVVMWILEAGAGLVLLYAVLGFLALRWLVRMSVVATRWTIDTVLTAADGIDEAMTHVRSTQR